MVLGSASLTFTPPAVGSYAYKAFYSGDSYFLANTNQNTFSQVVNQGVTTLSALSPASFSLAWGETTTFSTTISAVPPATGVPTGVITFLDVTQVPPVTVGSPVTLSAGSGFVTLTINSSLFSSTVGFHQIIPQYSGDFNYASYQAQSGQGTAVTVASAPTKVTLSASVAQPVYSQPLTISATFTVAPGSGYIVGTATFQDNGATISGGTNLPMLQNQASFAPSTAWSAGTHPVTVSTSVDPSKPMWSNVVSSALNVVIARASATITVQSSVNPLVAGQQTILTATVSAVAPATGVPTGSVTFSHGTSVLPGGSGITLSSGVATLPWTPAANQIASDLVLTIVYIGDSNWWGSVTTFAQTQIVASTTTTVAANPANGLGVAGQPIVLTATVLPINNANGLPTGFVTFYEGVTAISNPIVALPGVSGNVQASLTVTTFSVNLHNVYATYSGDNKFSGSSSNGSPFQVSVSQATPTVTLTTSAVTNSATFGQTVTFTATVTPPYPGVIPTGQVTFLDSSAPIPGAISLTLNYGSVTFTTSSLSISPLGSPHSIVARYLGDSNLALTNSNAVSVSIPQVATTLTLVGPSSAVYGQSVTVNVLITTSATNAGTPTGTITLYDNGNALSPTYPVNGYSVVGSLTTLTVSATSHSITAIYTGDNKFAGSTASAIPILVSKAGTTMILTAGGSLTVGQSVVLNAQLTVNSPSIQPLTTGNAQSAEVIIFSTGGAQIGQPQPFSSTGVASITYTPQTDTDLLFAATYNGDSNFLPSTYALGQSVNRATPSISVVYSPILLYFGQSVTITATVNGVNNGPTPTGTVTFFDNNQPLTGVLALVGGIAQLTFPMLSVGNHPISVLYSGDSRYTNFTQPSTAASTPSFNAATTSIALQSVPSSPYYGQTISLIAVVTVTNANSLATNPLGTVNFVVNSVNLGNAPVVNGAATLALTGSPYQSGSVGVSITYNPTLNSGYTGTNTQTTLSIKQANTTITLVAENNPCVLGQAINFQAVVNVPNFGGIPTGSITFVGSQYTLIGTKVGSLDGVTPVLNFPLTIAGNGQSTIQATYSGDANFLGSTVTIPVTANAVPLLGGVMNGIPLYIVPVRDPLTPMTNNAIIDACTAANLAYTCIGALSCCGTGGTSGYACDANCRPVFSQCLPPFQEITQQMCKSNTAASCFPINNIFMFAGPGTTSAGYGVGYEDGGSLLSGNQVIGQYALCAAKP